MLLVSKTTGHVVWKLGGTAYNKDGAQILTIQDDPETAFYLQHDARFQPNGNISLFDDHSACGRCDLEWPGASSTRSTSAPARPLLVWQYQGTASSAFLAASAATPTAAT